MLRRITLAACAALSLGTGPRAIAQEFRSTIFGSVIDQQQAGVPGARVLAREADTGVEASTVTGDTGQFALTYLAPGTYTITAEAPGFKRAVREKFTVSTNQRYQLELKLEVGVVAESVTVSAESSPQPAPRPAR
jgi:protocatechuate 3,4-dioxygenase beta subunit